MNPVIFFYNLCNFYCLCRETDFFMWFLGMKICAEKPMFVKTNAYKVLTAN